jgi:hypothetical protein
MTERFHHVANGSSTTGMFESAGIPGTCSIWADPLHDGPVPAGLSDADLIQIRTGFLSDGPVDPVNDMREWRAAIERHQAYDELILWYEHDLFCQLNLIQLLSWISPRVPASKTVSLICVNAFPGHPAFKGLGELSPGELASLLPARVPVSEMQYQLAALAWTAFRQPEPSAFDALRRADTSALPYLAAAIERFLQEFPWTTDGLSRSERRLLQLAAAGVGSLAAAFPRMHEGEHAYYITDLSLLDTAAELSSGSSALLTLGPAPADDHPLRRSVELTDAGRAVLAGELDRIAACGIDRWLGGVHLRDSGVLWRWDDTLAQISRQP